MVASMLAVGVVLSPVAEAAPGPVANPPDTDMVSADALPTAQINGVVWQQAIVGNTVFAGGSFSAARPAGAAPGTQLVTRTNLMAYDIRTGVMTSFAPNVNGQVLAVTASPDGSRIYIGGDFTQVDGVSRAGIAGFDTSTGQLDTSFNPNANSTVRALVATDTTVYAGGSFTASRGTARNRLAAFTRSTGALTGWAPSANAVVYAMVMAPGVGKLVVGGAFSTMNGVTARGMTAVDPTTGSVLPWQANQLIQNSGSNSAILSLTADDDSVYGTGYRFGSGGNLEGTFRANPSTGAVQWIEDCHGDTYDVAVASGFVYTVSHAHYCGNIGGFQQTEPWQINMRHALAFTKAATGTIDRERLGYFNWEGNPSPSLFNWFPDMTNGSYTGKTQAAWDVTANADYVVMGGEFPTVNGVNQQGLVRFAKRTTAPRKQGPRIAATAFTPRLTSVNSSSVRVAWQTNWDRDDLSLSYAVFRDNSATPLYTTAANSTFWNRPSLSFVDTSVPPGSHTYRIQALDRDQNSVLGNAVSITAGAPGVSPYAARVLQDGAGQYWRMADATGSFTALDSAGFADARIAAVAGGAGGAILGDSNPATTFAGTQSSRMGTNDSTPVYGPNNFSIEAWFRTSTTSGGKIIGFGSQSGFSANSVVPIDSQSYDRHLYMDNAGRINFGVNNGSARTITSGSAYNNNQWHHAVGTLGPTGMNLYVDGVRVANRSDVIVGQYFPGFWRVGGDNLNGWANRPTSNYFAGSIDEVAVYPSALTGAQVLQHYQLATAGPANQAPTAAFTTTSVQDLTATFDATGSVDSDGSISSYSWNWGDSTATGSGATPSHTYAAAGTYTVTLTVTDDVGATGTVSRSVSVSDPAPNVNPTAAFTRSVDFLDVDVDGTTSADPDGSISAYSWNWGDGTPNGSGPTASHRYSTSGDYTITLTVTDNRGGTASTSASVTTVEPPNQNPVAAFTSSGTGRSLSVNGSSSTDSDGSIADYSWTWGDGSPDSAGVTATHVYASAGSYLVTLRVTDNDGGTATLTRTVVVTDFVVADTFTRTVANAWGAADTGGTWTLSGGDTRFSVDGARGQIVMANAGSGPTAALNSLSAQDVDAVMDYSVDKVPAAGNGVYATVSVRRIGTSSYQYSLKYMPNGAVTISVARQVNGASTQLGSATLPGLSFAAGDVFRLRLQAIGDGTTTLAVKAWKVGSPEPDSFQLTRTDTTAALQDPGSLSIQSYLSSGATNAPITASIDNLSVSVP
ncbi:PKD domain-containing protein [Nakamurella sp.]|uniref:PKD domain-containing protein n=1 Tax=Nakamurella sp. TaxID=1869182 RepID=UPI003B3A62FC